MKEVLAQCPPDYLAPDLEELHQQRVAYSAQFNYDIDLMCDDIQRNAELRHENEAKAV
ncbi:MAG: hypothetical protein LBU65_04425 [Planctomycetaceae bacterium]|jgi:hypothetical protein|nr:hypothetical protein [Planctomycetaceae bacterium]